MSILRPEKRDPNYIRNKSDIGLSKVDNVSSAEFASIVLDQVRRYLNRETVYQTLGRRFIPLAKIGCKDDGSGNLIKILSGNLFITFAVLNESEEIREAVKLETIYTHYVNGTEVDYEDDTTKVEYNIFMTETDSTALLNECYLEFRENIYEDEHGTTVTEMYVVLRCDASNLPFVSINLFEYSNGGVALDPTIYDDATVASYNLIKTARLNHNRFSLVDRSEATIGFEIYDDAGNPFRVREEDDTINPDFDIPKINGVPFTGRKNVFVEGRNTRQITVNATHSGSTLLEAGPHDWEVLKYAPRAGHTYENKDEIVADNIYPQKAAFLDRDSFDAFTSNSETTEQDRYGYGLVRLSGCGNSITDGVFLPNRIFDPDLPMGEKVSYLYEWVDSLSRVDTDVISVRVFKTFADSMVAMFHDLTGKLASLRDILKELNVIPAKTTQEKKINDLFQDPSDTLGYHYIFDYVNTADSVTIVPHSGMEDKTCEIKMGVIGNGDGATIGLSSSGDVERGGDTSWVRISRVDNRGSDGASVTFSFSPNKTNESRYGYYIIYSNAYRTDGSRIGLVYRFYQDVITSTLRVKFTDANNYTEYYGLGATVKKEIDNDGNILLFDNISVVDNSILDELGNPSRIDRVLGYYVDNRYESSAVKVELIRSEDENRVLGFKASLPKNNTNDVRNVKIHILYNNVDILVLELIQSSREFEFTAPDSITVDGYRGSTMDFEITSNKTWTLDILKGGNYIDISTLDTGSSEIMQGTVSTSEDEKTFKRRLKVLKDNTTDKVNEVAILKLSAEGDSKKSKRIVIFQNGQPAVANIGTTRVNIPYYEGGYITIPNFYCTYDWVISVSPELSEWCKISPEKGEKVSDLINPVGVDLVLESLKTTKEVGNTLRGTFTIKYAGIEEVVEVYQDKAGFEFTTSKGEDVGVVDITDPVTLDYSKGSSSKVKVNSNYDWTIELHHTDSNNKRFKAYVDGIDGSSRGYNGSEIFIEALGDSKSDALDEQLGEIWIYSLTQVVKKLKIVQSKITISAKLEPSANAGWYATGDSKQSSTTTSVEVPIKFTPSSAQVTATYSISGGAQIAAKVNDTDTEGTKVIVIPSPGDNQNGSSRSVTVYARVTSAGASKDVSCILTQNGYSNGIRVNDTDYYGGTKNNVEQAYYFAPIIGDSKTFSNTYEPLGDSDLSVSVPTWLTISKSTSDTSSNDYLLKTRKTNSMNKTGTTKSGEITIVSGSDNDTTKIVIPVYQYSGTWVFGKTDGDTNFSDNYKESSPYELSMTNGNASEAAMNLNTYYTYSDKTVHENIEVTFTKECDWCKISTTKVDNTTTKISFISKSANTGESRSVIAKVKQYNTGDTFYIKITQASGAKLNFYGGVKGVDYILVNDSTDMIKLTSTQYNEIINYATKFPGSGEYYDSINKSVDFSKIKYVKVSGSRINTELVSNLTSGTTLYVAEVVKNNDGTGHITNVRSKNNYHGAIAQFKYDNSTKTISVQRFGSNRIEFIYVDSLLHDDYEYILTCTSSQGFWDPAMFDQSRDYYFRINHLGTSLSDEYFFTVDERYGLRYLTGASSHEVSNTVNKTDIYVWRKRPGDPNHTWQLCGSTTWDPTSPWNGFNAFFT